MNFSRMHFDELFYHAKRVLCISVVIKKLCDTRLIKRRQEELLRIVVLVHVHNYDY